MGWGAEICGTGRDALKIGWPERNRLCIASFLGATIRDECYALLIHMLIVSFS